jgi:translation initiation factor IF-3
MKEKIKETFKINNEINSLRVIVIDKDGKMIGTMDRVQAIKIAQKDDLDLIEVSSGDTPTCKIADFGKMKYQLQKKRNDAKKNQKNIETKEVKFSFNIGQGDYETKISKIKKFSQKGHKIKLSIKIKGREMQNMSIIYELVNNIENDINSYAKFDNKPKLIGRQLIGNISPLSTAKG